MPLFSKRSRSLSTSRVPPPPASSSAHVAAAQAFLATRQSQSNLSASAAAAALRTMSPPPTPVDQVQTKRMVNRQSSNSSIANAPRGRSRGSVQRSPSGGSMTERTFRSPSPGRQAPSQGYNGSMNDSNAPPVPPLPVTYTTEDVPPIPVKSHRRSASMEAPPPRVLSPPPSKPRGRGQNTGKMPPASSAATAAARRSAGLSLPAPLERTDSAESRNSFNFSYPRGVRPNSPPPRSPVTSFAPNGITAGEAANIQRDLSKTAEAPVKKKKKPAQASAEGSHFQAGTMSNKLAESTTESIDNRGVQIEQPAKTKKKKKAVLTGESSHFPDHQVDSVGGTGSDSDVTPEKIRRVQRASGVLAKQPSMVREDWEGEQGQDSNSPTSPTQPSDSMNHNQTVTPVSSQPRKQVTEANMSRKIEEPVTTTKQSVNSAVTTPASVPNESVKKLSPGDSSTRHTSISPSRSTRFSDRLSSDLASGRKHEPLGRSYSPAKSALKHHSPGHSDASPVDGRFPHRRASSVTPSEASDLSVDGLSKKKKSARVSFETESDTAAAAVQSESSTASAKDTSKKGWFGVGKQRTPALGTIPAEDDTEEGMKPRPALPSFGSVRKNKAGDVPQTPISKQENSRTVSSTGTSPSTDVSSTMEPSTVSTSVSSDHAIGGVLMKENQRQSNEPLPPLVTSVEGDGNVSDTDSVYSEDRAATSTHDMVTNSNPEQHQADLDRAQNVNTYLPAIAIQPATPGVDEMRTGHEWVADVPGGFPETSEQSNQSTEESPYTAKSVQTSEDKPSGFGMAHSIYATPSRESERDEPQALNTIAEEASDDNNSLYSDAAEDLSDLEGDGFGSINAIVGSPASPMARLSSPPESPLAALPQRPKESSRTASWEDAQSHWSGIAQQFRNSAQLSKTAAVSSEPAAKTEPQSITPASTEASLQQPAKNKAKLVKKNRQTKVSESIPQRVSSGQPIQAAPVKVAQQTTDSTMPTKRSSMVDKSQGGFRTSMRSPPEAVATLRERPKSMATPPTQPKAASQKKYIPPAAASRPMQRTFSNDSDSDSSFKKARRNKKPADGQYTMKRSMRSGPVEPERTSVPNNRRDVRSMSPVQRRPLSPAMGQTMRLSMRGSQDIGTPTLRGQKEHKRSSSLFSLGRKAKSPTRASAPVPSVPAAKSRFVDSDDELDSPRPNKFSSRFAESSDEDEPEPLRPVRGIPRKTDQADSTDLEDSSDDQRTKPKSPPKKLAIQVPPPSQPVEPEPMSPNTAKKKGFWDRFRGKKSPQEPNSAFTIGARNGVKPVNGVEHLSKNDAQLGFNSTAERDALVEQTRQKLEANKARATSPRPTSPKLQRRMTPQRVFSDSGPLPPPTLLAAEDRPNTSEGVIKPARPDLAGRQPTSDTLRTEGGTAVYGRSGKKKKFPMLRKAFGLHD